MVAWQMTESLGASEPEAPAPPPTFDILPLSADIRKAVDLLGYTHPTPVQRAVFEPAVRGKNLVVQARTLGDYQGEGECPTRSKL